MSRTIVIFMGFPSIIYGKNNLQEYIDFESKKIKEKKEFFHEDLLKLGYLHIYDIDTGITHIPAIGLDDSKYISRIKDKVFDRRIPNEEQLKEDFKKFEAMLEKKFPTEVNS